MFLPHLPYLLTPWSRFLIPGDYVLVNKMLKGPRIFSLGDARQHKPLHIDRLKGFSEFQRNEVLVFNFPYPERWDSIGFNLMLYYVKRCIALPGDTVEIRDARYRVRGYDKELGNIVSQNSLAHFFGETEECGENDTGKLFFCLSR